MRHFRPILGSRWSLALHAIVASLVLAGTLAAEFERRAGQTVVVGSDDIVPDDLYAFGETVRFEGTVQGDPVAAARQVIVAGSASRGLASFIAGRP